MVRGNLVKNLIKTIFGSSQHGHLVDAFGLGVRPYGTRGHGSNWGTGRGAGVREARAMCKARVAWACWRGACASVCEAWCVQGHGLGFVSLVGAASGWAWLGLGRMA